MTNENSAWRPRLTSILLGTVTGVALSAALNVNWRVRTQSAAPSHAGLRTRGISSKQKVDHRTASTDTEVNTIPKEPELGQVLAEISSLEILMHELKQSIERRPPDSFFAPDQAQLDEWVRCARLPVDVPPPLASSSRTWFSGEALDEVDATTEERAALEVAMTRFSEELRGRMSASYERVVGSPPVPERAVHAILGDLRALHTVLDDDGHDRRVVAMERAGHPKIDAPRNVALVELFRQHVHLGDEVEDIVATVLGRNRANALRTHGNGWSVRLPGQVKCLEKSEADE